MLCTFELVLPRRRNVYWSKLCNSLLLKFETLFTLLIDNIVHVRVEFIHIFKVCKVKWWEIRKISCFVHFFKLTTLHSNSAGNIFYLNKIRTNDLSLKKVENVRLENKNKTWGNPVFEVDRKADIYRTLWPRLIQFAWLHLQSPSSFPLSSTLFVCSLVSFNSVVLCMLWNYVIILECFVLS